MQTRFQSSPVQGNTHILYLESNLDQTVGTQDRYSLWPIMKSNAMETFIKHEPNWSEETQTGCWSHVHGHVNWIPMIKDFNTNRALVLRKYWY